MEALSAVFRTLLLDYYKFKVSMAYMGEALS